MDLKGLSLAWNNYCCAFVHEGERRCMSATVRMCQRRCASATMCVCQRWCASATMCVYQRRCTSTTVLCMRGQFLGVSSHTLPCWNKAHPVVSAMLCILDWLPMNGQISFLYPGLLSECWDYSFICFFFFLMQVPGIKLRSTGIRGKCVAKELSCLISNFIIIIINNNFWDRVSLSWGWPWTC